MGVFGLWYYIKNNRPAQGILVLPPQDGKPVKVLIDSLPVNMAREAYFSFVEEKKRAMPSIYDDSDILGGEAPFLAEATRNLLLTMRDHLKMEIYLLSDGTRFKEKQEGIGTPEIRSPVSETGMETEAAGAEAYQARNDELSDRRKKLEEEVRNIFKYARGLSDEKAPVRQRNAAPQRFPPHNFSIIVKEEVQKLNEEAKAAEMADWCQIHILKSINAEADEEVGKVVAKNNIDLIITSDTDMVVINHGADVTFFSQMPLKEMMAGPKSWNKVSRFVVYSHARLCKALDLNSPSASARAKATRWSQEQRQQQEDPQESLVEKFIQSPNDDSLLLYLAAGFTGNGITGPITDTKAGGTGNAFTALKAVGRGVKEMAVYLDKNGPPLKFVLNCRLLSAAREVGRREVAEGPRSSERPSLFTYRIVPFLEKWLLGPTSLLGASTRQYLRSADFLSPESKSPEEMFLNFHPEISSNRSEFFFFYSLFLEGTIGAPFTYLVEGLPTEEENEKYDFYYRGAGCDYSFRKLKTVRRFNELQYLLIEAQRKALGMKPTLETPKITWYEVYRKEGEAKQDLLKNVFNPAFPSVREAIDTSVSNNWRTNSGSPPPTVADAILWLLYPILDEVELRIMAAMLIASTRRMDELYGFLREVQNAFKGAKGGSPLSPKGASGRVNKRPSPRALELASLYSDAVYSLEQMAKFLGFGSVNSMFSPSPFSFSRIIESWSGSLFHYLYEYRQHLKSLPGISYLIEGKTVQGMLDNARWFGAEFKEMKA